MELITVNINDIIPYWNNPRKNDKAADALVKSIQECGYCSPIVVDEDMVVLAGHTRLKALYKLGVTDVQVMKETGLTEEEKKKYRILDNKTNEFAKWDYEALKQEVKDLDFDMSFGIADLLSKGLGYDSDDEQDEHEEEGDGIFVDDPGDDEEYGDFDVNYGVCKCPRCGCRFPEARG